MKRAKKVLWLGLVGLFLIGLPVTVWAANKNVGSMFYVGPDEIIEGNFIKAGSTIDIAGAVNGDVIVAGNSVVISGSVAGDVIAAGNSVKILGPVGGSVRVVGSTVDINNEVERNVWALGSSVSLGAESKVGWDVFAAGASVELRGPIAGNAWSSGANILIGSDIGKDLTAQVDEGGEITLYPQAKVNGNLNYRAVADDQLKLNEGSTIGGEVVRNDFAAKKPQAAGQLAMAWVMFKIVALFSLLVIGIVYITLVPKIALQINDEMIKRPAQSLGWGFAYSILIPVVVLILLLTIIGIPLALIIVPIYFIALCVSKVIAGFALGLLIINQLSKDKKYKGNLLWPLILGLLVFTALTVLPLVGWLITILSVWWALGAMIQVKKSLWKEFR
ncbi:MAG: polymer-forming cytoskeletal protein [Patescibacteria group bacterium]|jgi:hypothetical protein|nr:polymer-forming cytoskeletal protein [Patescibacteria group bacterium]